MIYEISDWLKMVLKNWAHFGSPAILLVVDRKLELRVNSVCRSSRSKNDSEGTDV